MEKYSENEAKRAESLEDQLDKKTIEFENLEKDSENEKKKIEAEALFAQTLDSRLKKVEKSRLVIPKPIFGILFIIVFDLYLMLSRYVL